MRFINIESLAERWTVAHTIAVAAWALAVLLGLMLLVRGNASTYPDVSNRKVYAAENATFSYPENWTINNCDSGKPFIELPGTIRSDYKKRGYELTMYGTGAYNCIKDRPERLDIYTEEIKAGGTPCSPSSSTPGERLENGLYLQLQEEGDDILAVHIRQNSCYAPSDTLVLGFGFVDPESKPGDLAEHGVPRVSKEDFLASRQYKDIVDLAQSIKY